MSQEAIAVAETIDDMVGGAALHMGRDFLAAKQAPGKILAALDRDGDRQLSLAEIVDVDLLAVARKITGQQEAGN